jgi:hypothetical protein
MGCPQAEGPQGLKKEICKAGLSQSRGSLLPPCEKPALFAFCRCKVFVLLFFADLKDDRNNRQYQVVLHLICDLTRAAISVAESTFAELQTQARETFYVCFSFNQTTAKPAKITISHQSAFLRGLYQVE